MSGGGKKFNIWIAYSDLFTNLSTFLFISALGIFAALGTGALGQLGAGGSARCTVASEIGKAMAADSELLEYIGSVAETKASCSEFYRIKDYAFASSAAERGQFRAEGGQILPLTQIFRDICQPIWLTIPRKDFVAYNGKVVFHGIGAENRRWRRQPQCKQVSWSRPRVGRWSFPDGRAASQAVQRCDKGGDALAASDNFCKDIAICRSPAVSADYSLCAEVAEVREWDAYASAACRREIAQLQARTLYRMCELAPTNSNFPDRRFAGDNMHEDARYPERRPHFWGKVDYNAPIRDTRVGRSSAPASPSPLDSEPGGSVVVELRFGR